MSTEPTIERLREHDPDAWAALYDGHARELWRFVHRRTGCRATADDLASETFLAAVESIAQCDPARGTVSQWLYGIARRKLADHLRRRVKLRLVGELTDDVPARSPPGALPGAERIVAVMRELPAAQRDVLTWMYHDGLSVRQIAERMNRSEKAVENLLYRARERLRAGYERAERIETQRWI